MHFGGCIRNYALRTRLPSSELEDNQEGTDELQPSVHNEDNCLRERVHMQELHI